jgi:hypothetical protein
MSDKFGLGSKGKDNCIHLTETQAALIKAEFTDEGKKFFGDLYTGLHKDTFGDVAGVNKKITSNHRLGDK